MLIQKIHCVAKRTNKLELKPRDCPFLRTVSICRVKTITKWQCFKDIMAELAWSG